ncbi:sp110 nuclear body protein-like [Hemibagrus wyckioides]|uniref:sp110 nuclear body protein-like n=1 Tax=Hemibagrus wyckioides TaxID=337641 RepID=UPI00266D90FD|nr:sp110 nuclear body protein-like [Hemibagrus wyckioides]
MDRDRFDLLLELVPQDVLTLFFHRKKTAISSQVDEPFTFLNQLQDHDLITEDLCQEVTNARSKDGKQKGVHTILNYVEKQGVQSIKTFWRCVFEAHMLQKCPFLCSLMTSLLEDFVKVHGEPDTKKVTGSERKKGRNKRKRCTDESEGEEPHTSSVSGSTRKRAKRIRKPRISPVKEEEPEDCCETLSVSCGDKEGTLYVDKLARGEECVLSEDQWFTPHEFERFSGKGNSKNWKHSIRYRNTPLQNLLNEGHLQCPRTYRRYDQKKTRLASSCVAESSSPLSNVKLEEEDIKQEEEEEEEEEEDDSEPADLSKFQVFALPVCCGSASGTLYKSRFAGPSSKSIRTEEHWFSPEEFVKQEITLTEGHWKKDILCHGKTLNYLVKKKILYIHSLLCYCVVLKTRIMSLARWEPD